ncbi:MAG: tryptophan--tRNA ligase, partial [Lachnospiraceae bacterium]|nr:tryptophan--tRNA ligase [Lachnospiraceae bacterium]
MEQDDRPRDGGGFFLGCFRPEISGDVLVADGLNKKRILSGIQPSGEGIFTLGNYIGAVRNWTRMQEEFDCAYFIADLHSITVRQDPQTLKKQTLSAFALLLACGINPEENLVFVQSHVHEHAELGWIMSCYSQFGELSRMTQFKDKSSKHADNVNAGLFTYPALMAADILLYQADLVPVGADQKQHLEFTRDIATRFNNLYGEVFKLPDAYIPPMGAKIMSLQEPDKKMSKSDPNPKSKVFILDEENVILKKFKSAVTDSETEVVYREGKDGINNLMTIYASITGKSYELSMICEDNSNTTKTLSALKATGATSTSLATGNLGWSGGPQDTEAHGNYTIYF